jgi:hypothetical protein
MNMSTTVRSATVGFKRKRESSDDSSFVVKKSRQETPDLQLKAILKKNDTNHFIPSPLQTALIDDAIKQKFCPDYGKMGIVEWHNKLWDDSDGGPLFAMLGKIAKSVLYDQLDRANKIIQKMIETNKMTIYTMDGHGRFLLCLIHQIIALGKDPNLFTFCFIDINRFANKWHEVFFPHQCYAIHVDILAYMSNSFNHTYFPNEFQNVMPDLDNNDIDFADVNVSFFYLNFCGITKAIESYGIRNFKSLMKTYAECNNIALSLSARGLGQSSNSPAACVLKHLTKLKMWHPFANRGMFHSGFITKKSFHK